MNAVYAGHASAAFNARLHLALQRLAAEVRQALRDNLVALVLGGGYGRGEGGVVHVAGVERPYNDLDLILVVKRKTAVPEPALSAIGQNCGAAMGVHIDFSRPLTLGDIRRWPPWLRWVDLLNGHIVLMGPPQVLRASAPAALHRPLPLLEATRLLLNRGAGLLWALRVARGAEPAPDRDFVRRNYYKCALALGDGLLIAHRLFATPYQGRDRRLAQLAAISAPVAALRLEPLYHTALRFKFTPDEVPDQGLDEQSLQALAERWGAVFLHVERRRTGGAWPSLAAYAQWRGLREPEQNHPLKWPRNIAQNRRLGRWSWRYPREELYWQLPVLLGLAGRQRANWREESADFLDRWKGFN